MAKPRRRSTHDLFDVANRPLVQRSLLKDNTAELLRDYIVSGRVEPGAKLAERQVSEALGVSRMPIRDAMIVLEQQGLVVSRMKGRYVVEVSREEARQLTAVRSALEVLAVELAVESLELADAAALTGALARMEAACRARETAGFIQADLEIHGAIWRAGRNPFLERTLTTILGPLQVAVANSAVEFDWVETLEIHAVLVRATVARDRAGALAAIRGHMESITR